MMNIEKTNNKSYSSWKKLLLKDFCKKCIVKNTDKKHSLVFTNSVIYGIVKQADYFEKDVANSDNTDSYYVVNTKDFIYNPRISENAPYGPIRTNETGEVGIVSPLYFVFRIADETIADYNFLKYYFTSSNWHRYVYSIGNNGARSDRMNISDADFMAMPVALPSLEEQRRIAKILDCCNRGIALKKELIAEKKKQKKALMQKLLNPDSGFRLPGFSGEWKKVILGQIGTFSGGGTPDTKCESFWDGSIPWISSADVDEKSFHANIHRFISEEAMKSSATQLCPKGTLLLVSRVGVGKVAIAEEPLCTSQDFTNLIKINGDIVFYAYLLKSILEERARQAQGTSIKGITVAEIKKFAFNVPQEFEEQQAIADILSAADKEIDLLEQELSQQEQKKKSLMQLLLTGIVRV